MPKLPWTMLLLFLATNPALANDPASAKGTAVPPALADTQPKSMVEIPIYNPKCHLWIPASQSYRKVPVEEAEAAMKKVTVCTQ